MLTKNTDGTFCWVSLRSGSSSVQLPKRILIQTDGKLCFHPGSIRPGSDLEIYTHPMQAANRHLSTARTMKPDTIKNWSSLVSWWKQAFLTTWNPNGVSRRLHLTLIRIYLGGSAHVVPSPPTARQGRGSHTWLRAARDWKKRGMCSGERTHHRSRRAASAAWAFPAAARPMWMGIFLLVGRSLPSSWPCFHAVCPPQGRTKESPGEGAWCACPCCL